MLGTARITEIKTVSEAKEVVAEYLRKEEHVHNPDFRNVFQKEELWIVEVEKEGTLYHIEVTIDKHVIV